MSPIKRHFNPFQNVNIRMTMGETNVHV